MPSPAPSPAPAPSPEVSHGLNYQYFEGEWVKLPQFTTLKVQKQGQVTDFDLSVREQEEHFGILYYGEIQIDKAGAYTFYTKSDDGSTLYINGKLVVDNDGLHSPRERSGKVQLSAGRHQIEVHFFERRIGQVLEVRYECDGLKKQRIPETKLYPAERTQAPTPAPAPVLSDATPGLRYAYYEGRWSKLPAFENLKVIKNGVLANFSLSPARQDRYFGLVFTGYIKVEKNGKYTFYTTSDDGSQLYINGQQLVDNDGLHAARERSGRVQLSSGYHKIEVRYFENAYAENLAVSYQGPGVSKQTIPDAVLFLNRPSGAKTTVATPAKNSGRAPESLQSGQQQVSIYPNPSHGVVNVQLGVQEDPVTIQVKNLTGHVLYQHEVHNTILNQVIPISLSDLSLKAGVYLVSVEGASVGSHAFRLVRE